MSLCEDTTAESVFLANVHLMWCFFVSPSIRKKAPSLSAGNIFPLLFSWPHPEQIPCIWRPYSSIPPVVKISSGVTSSITEEHGERFHPSPTATCNANPVPNGALTSQKTAATFPAVHSQSVFVYPKCSHYQHFVVYDKWQPFAAGCKKGSRHIVVSFLCNKEE